MGDPDLGDFVICSEPEVTEFPETSLISFCLTVPLFCRTDK